MFVSMALKTVAGPTPAELENHVLTVTGYTEHVLALCLFIVFQDNL